MPYFLCANHDQPTQLGECRTLYRQNVNPPIRGVLTVRRKLVDSCAQSCHAYMHLEFQQLFLNLIVRTLRKYRSLIWTRKSLSVRWNFWRTWASSILSCFILGFLIISGMLNSEFFVFVYLVFLPFYVVFFLHFPFFRHFHLISFIYFLLFLPPCLLKYIDNFLCCPTLYFHHNFFLLV